MYATQSAYTNGAVDLLGSCAVDDTAPAATERMVSTAAVSAQLVCRRVIVRFVQADARCGGVSDWHVDSLRVKIDRDRARVNTVESLTCGVFSRLTYECSMKSDCSARWCAFVVAAVVSIAFAPACDTDSSRSRRPDAGPERTAENRAQCESSRDCLESDELCSRATHECTPLRTDECRDVVGPWQDAGAVWIGSLFSLSGAQARTNAARRDGVVLAVERINQLGGVPFPAIGGAPSRRPLVLVSCDESRSLERAASHLIGDLGVRAIVGPNTSQDTLDVARELAIRSGALLITPTAMASDVAHLLDDDLVWQMVPTTSQRASFFAKRIETLASRIERARGGVRVAIAYRDDVLGLGVRNALSQLQLNGKPLTDPENLGYRVRIDAYDPSREAQREFVASYAAWKPDLIVLAGTAEAVTDILGPLERAWDRGEGARPFYMVTDASKVPELLDVVEEVAGLASRIQGVGVVPSSASQPVHDAVLDAYRARFAEASAEIAGVAAAYDATCALSFGLSAAGVAQPAGADVARGLRSLARGSRQVRTDQLDTALPTAAARDAFDPLGTLGTLRWDEDGVFRGATLALWCVQRGERGLAFVNSGVTYDVETKATADAPVACDWLAEPVETAPRESSSPAADLPPTAAKPPAAPPQPAEAPPSAAMPPPPQPEASAPASGPQDAGMAMPDASSPDAGSADSGREPLLPPVFATLRRDNEWAEGYCDTVTVVNLTTEDNPWTVELTIDGEIYDHWNCEPSATTGMVKFRGADWNRTLGPLQNTNFGFCVRRRPPSAP